MIDLSQPIVQYLYFSRPTVLRFQPTVVFWTMFEKIMPHLSEVNPNKAHMPITKRKLLGTIPVVNMNTFIRHKDKNRQQKKTDMYR